MSLYRRSSSTSSYQELPKKRTIRLLRLDTGSTKLEGLLVNASLDSEQIPPFYALSYCWGTGRKCVRIGINDAEICITRSLATALQGLKALNSKGTINLSKSFLWIDQICINQADLGERGSQVSLMDEIYSRSQKTLIWLGEDKKNAAPEAFHLLDQIWKIFVEENPGGGPLTIRPKGIKAFLTSEDLAQKGLPKLNEGVWTGLRRLLNHDWFRRLWVVQEVVLSPDDPIVIWGRHLFAWQILSQSSRWLFESGLGWTVRLGDSLQCVNIIEDMREARIRNVDFDLGSLTTLTRGYFSTTDARDKVYGVLGIARYNSRPTDAPEFAIHYDIDTSSVYSRATLYTITSTKSLAILVGAKCPTPAVQDPNRRFGGKAKCASSHSWVQNFSHNIIRESWLSGYTEFQDADRMRWKCGWRKGLHASKELEAEISQESLRSGKLKLRGIVVDIVDVRQETLDQRSFGVVPKPMRNREVLWRFKSDFQYWNANRSDYGAIRPLSTVFHGHIAERRRPAPLRIWELAVEHDSSVEPSELITALLNVLSAGTTLSGGVPGSDDPKVFAAYMIYLNREWNCHRLHRCSLEFLRHVDAVSAFADGVGLEQFNPFRMTQWCPTQRFFITKNGYMGIGSGPLQRGDRLCVLFGGGVPFILRKVNGTWALIGASFTNDLMDGEAIEAWQRGELKDQWFEFC